MGHFQRLLATWKIWRLVQSSRNSDFAAPIRLNLGSGNDRRSGMVNIDVDTRARPDIKVDFISACRRFPSESVSYVAMFHSLSYIRLWEARELFAEIHRILQADGVFVIETPDIFKCSAHILQECGTELDRYLEGVRGCYAFDTDQIDRKVYYQPYAFGWSAWHLTIELNQVGFTHISEPPPQTHGQRLWRDIRIECKKSV